MIRQVAQAARPIARQATAAAPRAQTTAARSFSVAHQPLQAPINPPRRALLERFHDLFVAPPVKPRAMTSPSAEARPTPRTRKPFATLPDGSPIESDGIADLYHGTDLHPDQVIRPGPEGGLPARGDNLDLREHCEPSGTAAASAFRGATTVPAFGAGLGGSAGWAGEGGWLYHVQTGHVDPHRVLEGRIQRGTKYGGLLMKGEYERTIPARVPVHQIKRYGRVKDGRVEQWIDNPHHQAGSAADPDAPSTS